MDGVAHLLVEEDVVGEAVDAAVHADAEFTELARAAVGLDDAVEDCLALLGRPVDDDAVLECQLDVLDARPCSVIGTSKVTSPDGSPYGRGEHLAGGRLWES